MPSACVGVMLCIFSTDMQPHEHRLQAGRVTASLLSSHKCQRTALRSALSLLCFVPQKSTHLQCMPCSQAQQAHLQQQGAVVHVKYALIHEFVDAGRGKDLIASQHK